MQTQHKLIAYGGRYLIMPPDKAGQSGWNNMTIPNVHTAGGDVSQGYPTNTKFVDFDRTFIYGYCSAKANAAVKSNVALFNDRTPIANCTWGGIAGVVGDTVCPFLTSDLGDYTTAAVNLFAGGYLMPRFGGAVPYGTYRIVSSTVYAGGADATTETDMVIEEPGLGAAVDADAAYCHLNPNPYTAMKSEWLDNGGEYKAAMGITLIDPTAARYQWVQTWGPLTMLGDELSGKGIYLREVFIHIDGSLVGGTQGDHSTTVQRQTAGYLLGNTEAQVYSALIMLTMTP